MVHNVYVVRMLKAVCGSNPQLHNKGVTINSSAASDIMQAICYWQRSLHTHMQFCKQDSCRLMFSNRLVAVALQYDVCSRWTIIKCLLSTMRKIKLARTAVVRATQQTEQMEGDWCDRSASCIVWCHQVMPAPVAASGVPPRLRLLVWPPTYRAGKRCSRADAHYKMAVW